MTTTSEVDGREGENVDENLANKGLVFAFSIVIKLKTARVTFSKHIFYFDTKRVTAFLKTSRAKSASSMVMHMGGLIRKTFL